MTSSRAIKVLFASGSSAPALPKGSAVPSGTILQVMVVGSP